VQAALADQALALYGQCAVLSRATTLVQERGEAACADELLLARATCRRLARRGRGAVASLRDNDDDLLLQAADLVRRSGLPGDLP